MTFTVDVASLGEMPMPGPEVFWMSDWEQWFDGSFLMVVARSDEHTVVVNTGPPPDLDPLNAMWAGFHPSGRCQFSRSPEQQTAAVLERLGVDPASVTHVVLTPMVVYTTGSLELFPNAQYVVSRRGWIEDVLAPPYAPHLPREIFAPDPVLKHLLFKARDRLQLVGDGPLLPGLSVWESLVHHRSSLAVCFDTAAGSVVATDSAFAYRNVEDNVYLGIGESYPEAMATYARLRTEADLLIPLYDPRVLDRHPGGRVA